VLDRCELLSGPAGEWFRLLESLIRTPTDTFGRARRSGAKYVELPGRNGIHFVEPDWRPSFQGLP
jgi:hypothetical protein